MLKKTDDYSLIQECINGNKEAFSELISRYKNLIYSIVLRMTNDKEEANDLAQEVFIKVYRNLDKFKPEYKFSTWIIRIATNHVIDHRRRKKFNTVEIGDLVNEPSTHETPEEIYIKNEDQKKVMDALNNLPDMYKIPMILYHQNGLSYQDIANVIDEPLSKVKNRIFRARKMLKDNLIKADKGR